MGKFIYIDIFVNCNWVNTRWQCYSTHNQYIEQHNNNRTAQITAQHNNNRKTLAQHNDNYFWRVRTVPRLVSLTLAFALQLRKKHEKTSVRVVKECCYPLPKHPHNYNTHHTHTYNITKSPTHPYSTKPTHTHTPFYNTVLCVWKVCRIVTFCIFTKGWWQALGSNISILQLLLTPNCARWRHDAPSAVRSHCACAGAHYSISPIRRQDKSHTTLSKRGEAVKGGIKLDGICGRCPGLAVDWAFN